MSNREADRFEAALEQASRGGVVEGRMAPLVKTAQHLAFLADTPPLPPHRLAPGRQQLLSEAARLRDHGDTRSSGLWRTRSMGFAAAFAAVVLVMGLVFGAGRVAADSVPGEPLYGFKLAFEGVRTLLTSDVQSLADLHLALVDERLGEILVLLADEQSVGQKVARTSEQQLEVALQAASELDDAAASQALGRLATAIQQRQRSMQAAAGEAPEPPLRDLMREMERVRAEAQAGQGDPDALRKRLGRGAPGEPALAPDPGQTPRPPEPTASPEPAGVPGHGDGSTPTAAPSGPEPTEPPGQGPDPRGTGEPSGPERTGEPEKLPGDQAEDEPGGPKRAGEPWQGPDPQPTAVRAEPSPTETPSRGSQATPQPGEPDPTGGADPGTGPQPTTGPGSASPTGEPGGPDPTGEPDPGPDSDATGEPVPGSGPGDTDEPGPGPGPGPTDTPGGRGG